MFWVHGLGELGARNLAPSLLVSARYRIYGDRADVDGAEDVVNCVFRKSQINIPGISDQLA